jgi:DASS family divalent anion:Na+ symporter
LPHYLPKFKPLLFCVAIGLILWHIVHCPDGLSAQAWHLLIIFSITILGVILKPMPMGALCILATVSSVSTKTLTLEQALAGFQAKVVWFVVLALFIAKGFSETGLGRRIGYYFTALLGKHTLGLGYGLALSDLIMAPAVPSVTGRSAGIIFPIMRAISDSFESYTNNHSSKRIGAFLVVTIFQASVLSSSMFLTAMAANPLLQILVREYADINLGWGTWALAAIVPGLICFICLPLFIYYLYPPTIKETPKAPHFAREQLKEMGPMSIAEWIMTGTVVLLLSLWIADSFFKIDPLLAAFIGFSCLLLGGVLNWLKLMQDDTVWETFIWFSVLVMLAKFLGEFGIVSWFKMEIETHIGHLDWKIAFPIISLLYFYTHYFFASSVAHVSAMFPAFLSLSLSLGTPPMLAVLILIYFSNLMGGLTHYSLSPAPVLYGAGYCDIKDWWRIGALVSFFNILVFSTIGVVWWHVLGLW